MTMQQSEKSSLK